MQCIQLVKIFYPDTLGPRRYGRLCALRFGLFWLAFACRISAVGHNLIACLQDKLTKVLWKTVVCTHKNSGVFERGDTRRLRSDCRHDACFSLVTSPKTVELNVESYDLWIGSGRMDYHDYL